MFWDDNSEYDMLTITWEIDSRGLEETFLSRRDLLGNKGTMHPTHGTASNEWFVRDQWIEIEDRYMYDDMMLITIEDIVR